MMLANVVIGAVGAWRIGAEIRHYTAQGRFTRPQWLRMIGTAVLIYAVLVATIYIGSPGQHLGITTLSALVITLFFFGLITLLYRRYEHRTCNH